MMSRTHATAPAVPGFCAHSRSAHVARLGLRRATVAAVCGVLSAAAACTGERSEHPIVPLISLPEGAAGELTGRDEARPATDIAEMTRGEVSGTAAIEGFIGECGSIQRLGRERAGNRITGVAFRGSAPEPDPVAPPDASIFEWVESDAEYLDPGLLGEMAGTVIAIQMFETLLVHAPDNAPPRPGAAERYDVSPDGLTYTFHLRPALVWSDGRPLTARDFVYAMRRVVDPATGSRSAQMIADYVQGGRAVNRGEKPPETLGVTALDDRTLRIELVAPTAYFPHLLTHTVYMPVPRHAIEAHGADWVRPGNIVVNGPYILTEWLPRDHIVLERNPRYWDAEDVEIERSIVHLSDDEQKNLHFYETGQAYVVNPIPPTTVRSGLRSGRGDLRIDEEPNNYLYVLRTDRPPFDEPAVRRAFNMAIDKERLVKHVLGAFQRPATHILSPMFESISGYYPVEGDAFDPAAARRLLAEAGYPGGVGLPEVEVIYNTSEGHRMIAELVQRSLREHLGVHVELRNMEWKSFLKQIRVGDFQMAPLGWTADFPDPLTFLDVFDSGSENNFPGYRNPAFDALLGRIKREPNAQLRNVLICAAEMTLNHDMPAMPFYFRTRAYLLRPFVEGYEPQYQDLHLLKYIRIRR